MKHFFYNLITLLQIGFLCNAAQVGFNIVGYVTNVPGDSSGYNAVAVDSQGRIIVVGDTDTINGLNDGLIARFLTDGTLDTTFNETGFINQADGLDVTAYHAVTVDSQGRIIAVGTTDGGDGLIARYLDNGELDQEFNGTGFINQAGNTNSLTYLSVAIDNNGRIIVVGSTDGGDGLIARYLPNGELDQAFNRESVNGAPGFINQAGNTNSNIYHAVTVDSQGRIIVVGRTDGNDGLIARFNPNGELDQTFNGTGFINQEGDTNSFGYNSVAIDSQGRIIVVGRTDGNGGNTIHGLIARYLPNGTLDTTFNEPYGFINADLPTDSYLYNEVAIDSQGRIIVVGRTDQVNANFNGLITRFNNEGVLDVTFNRTGFISNIPGNSFEYHSVAIDSQGRIIVVGETDGAGVAVNGLIARFLSNGVLDAESNWNAKNYRESKNISNISIGLLG